jgi:hypothetical protein
LLRIKRLFVHLVATLVIAVGMTVAAQRFDVPKSAAEVVIPAAVLLFIAHALWLMYREGQQFIIRQEIERERADAEMDEKPKREERLALGDDGELIEITDDEAYEEN